MSQTDVPLYDPNMLRPIDFSALAGPEDDGHAPRILLLYGSLRPQSYSRAVAEEGARVLRALGCETKFFDPTGLPSARWGARQPSQGARTARIGTVERGYGLVQS